MAMLAKGLPNTSRASPEPYEHAFATYRKLWRLAWLVSLPGPFFRLRLTVICLRP